MVQPLYSLRPYKSDYILFSHKLVQPTIVSYARVITQIKVFNSMKTYVHLNCILNPSSNLRERTPSPSQTPIRFLDHPACGLVTISARLSQPLLNDLINRNARNLEISS